MKRSLVAVAVCLFLASVGQATTFNTSATYSTDQATDGGVRMCDSSATGNVDITFNSGAGFTGAWASTKFFQVGRSGSLAKVGTLTYDGGTQSSSASPVEDTVWFGYTNNSIGNLVIQNGGRVYFGNPSSNYFGAGCGTAGSGNVYISGSSSVFSVDGDLTFGYTYSNILGRGYCYQTGGSVSLTGTDGGGPSDLALGYFSNDIGEYTISGGSLSVVGDLDLDGGTALFHVNGSGATSISALELLTRVGGSTLKFTVDAGGVDYIGVGSGQISVSGTVDMAGTPTVNTWYDLVVRSGGSGAIDISNLTLASGDETLWQLRSTEEGRVQAGYMIPEPATMGLLGLGVLGLMLRRKR